MPSTGLAGSLSKAIAHKLSATLDLVCIKQKKAPEELLCGAQIYARSGQDSNPRHLVPKTSALSAELPEHACRIAQEGGSGQPGAGRVVDQATAPVAP